MQRETVSCYYVREMKLENILSDAWGVVHVIYEIRIDSVTK